jgi:predicted kinase
MKKPTFFMMHGDFGSGKSTFAQNLAGEIDATWLRSDKIRAEMRAERQAPLTAADEELVFDSMNQAAFQALSEDRSVIYDATWNYPSFRWDTRAATADRLGVPAVIIWLQTPLAECIRRAADRRHDEYAVSIGAAKVTANAAELINPASDELYVAIDGMKTFAEQYAQFTDQLEKVLS